MKIILNDYKISSLTILNREALLPEENIRLNYKYDIVPTSETSCTSKCTGTLYLPDEKVSETPNFLIEMELEGYFSYNGQCDKEALSFECAKSLLPFLRTHISTAMASIGMSPILIPIENLKRFDNMN